MTHRIGIVIFDGVTLLDATGPAEVLHLADPGGDHYSLTLISSEGQPVRSSSGIEVGGTVAASGIDRLDTLLVAGGARLVSEPIEPGLLAMVDRLGSGAARVASVCTGAFILAELGYLDGRRATTHWRHASELARRFPRITVESDVIHLQDGRYLTSAGITAGIDLALAMVEDDLGADAAREVARELVVFMQRPGGQTQFSAALHGPPAQSGALRQLLDSVTADAAGEHSVSSMAASLGVSPRHLNRLFQSELGSTPAKWLERTRVDLARALILDGHSITRVAELCGLGSDDTLRRAFARHLGTTPTAFRDRFASTRER